MRLLILIPLYNNSKALKKALPELEIICSITENDTYDLLIVDDGSDESLDEVLSENKWIRCVRHEQEIGFGGAFITGYTYARDFNYDALLALDPDTTEFCKDIPIMIENLKYGYDIVSCSRILENYEYKEFSELSITITNALSEALKNITGELLTDPLSPIKAIQMKCLENMELTEFSHGLLLQLWVQAAYFGLSSIEIPATSGESFGNELLYDEDPLETYLFILEAEHLLYRKNSMN